MSPIKNKINDIDFIVRNIEIDQLFEKQPDLNIPQSELLEKNEIERLAIELPFEGQYRQGYCEDDWSYAGYDICRLRSNKIGNAYPYHIEIGGKRGNYRLYLRLDFDSRNIPKVKICERRFNSKRKAKKWAVQKIFDFEKTSIVKNTLWYLIFKERAAVVKKETENGKDLFTWVFSIFGISSWQTMDRYKKGNHYVGGEKLIDPGTYYVYKNGEWSFFQITYMSLCSHGLKREQVPAEAVIAIHGFDQKLDEHSGILKCIDEKRKFVFIQTNKNPNEVFQQTASKILQKINE